MADRRKQLEAAVAVIKAKNNFNKGGASVGGTAVTDKTIYIATSVKGAGGIIKLIDTNTKKEVGVTNIDGNKLNAGRDYVIDSARVVFDTGNANVKNAAWDTKLPVQLMNAELKIKQDNQLLFDMPLSDLFLKEFGSGGMAVGGDNLFRDISTSPLIRAEEEFEIELEFPKGSAMDPAIEASIRFEFRVHQGKK